MNPTPVEILASILFGIAVIHTFCVKRFATWAHHSEEGSVRQHLLHFLAETEVVFGLWAAVLFVGIAALTRSFADAIAYIDSLNFTEPKFVFVIMVVAATRPVVQLTEGFIAWVARRLPFPEGVSFYFAALAIGPLLGSFITEPAAMTLLALMLKRRYFDNGISTRLAYATLGLLFVNISIGGTLTNFAAPPVLMVSGTWHWETPFMLATFGWRAAISCVVSTVALVLCFRRELAAIVPVRDQSAGVPVWLTLVHVATLILVVAFAHHPDLFFGVFILFLGLVTATPKFQDALKLREGLLVGFFLAGLVTLGFLQAYWLKPLLARMDGNAMFYGATALTAITDNAALTYLGSLVEGISDELKFALVAGAITGGD
jgi:hypothetical protein